MSWKYLEKYPPPFVRLMARRKISGSHIAALSDEEVAISSGLPSERITEISKSRNWDDVSVGEIRSFCKGCNFDPFDALDRNRVSAYMRKLGNTPEKSRLVYLKRDQSLWRNVFIPLLKTLKDAEKS